MATSNNHIPNHHHVGTAPDSPSMSTSNNQAPSRPAGYPSPTSYPSPTAQYNYPPPGGQQQGEPYRASPGGGGSGVPNMRPLGPHQQQQQQHMGSPLPPPVAQMGGPYYHPSGQVVPHPGYTNVTSDPNGNMRYQLPASDSRQMSGGRHKKEIKRRTKTGCLTCRKRRIKCDEAHPQCRNCIKSKRECLGYDPIFKQQPGPSAIQPAPSSAPSHGSISAVAHPYGNQPPMIPGYGAPSMNYDPALSAGVNSQSPASQQFDFASAIDPALEAAAAPPAPITFSQPAKRSVADLLSQGANPPLPSTTDKDAATPDEIKHLFYSIYAPGLENFLESKWFAHKGLEKLLVDEHCVEHFNYMSESMKHTNTEDKESMAAAAAVEARLVWALADLVRQGDVKSSHTLVPTQDDPLEASHRLTVFETLLTGAVATTNALTQPVPGSTDHHRLRELEFWYTLGTFVCLQYDQDGSAKTIDDTLAALRVLLDGRENRDVLYSVAVIRAMGQRVAEYDTSDEPVHFDETDNRSKLSVAKKFVVQESEGGGTTNVIRRMCGLVSKTWATPPAAAPAPAAETNAQ